MTSPSKTADERSGAELKSKVLADGKPNSPDLRVRSVEEGNAVRLNEPAMAITSATVSPPASS